MNRWWLNLIRYALPEWRGLIGIALLMVANIGVKLLGPWPLKLIVDNAIAGRELPKSLNWIYGFPGATTAPGLLAWLSAATVALFFAKRLVSIALHYLEAGTGSRMTYQLASDLFLRLQQRSLSFHGRRQTGDLVSRVTQDSGCVKSLIIEIYLPIITALLVLVSMFAVMWQLSPTLAFLALGISIPLGLVTKHFSRLMTERGYQQKKMYGEVISLAEQALTALPIVQAFGQEQRESQRFRSLTHRTVQANLRSLISQEQFRVATSAVTTIGTATVMVIGGLAVLEHTITVGELLVVLAYFTSLYSPLETLAYTGTGFATAGAGARRVLEVFGVDNELIRQRPGAKALSKTKGFRELTFDQVTFGYEEGVAVLRDVTFQVQAGEKIALVGPTGAGKSTLASLILRLHDPWSGSISIDGEDLRNLQLNSLRENVAMVLQDPFLFPMSLADNIAYGVPGATRDDIHAAAKAANADAFISRLPDGYDTVIGERGATLSGGEKQRISIARALLKNAPLLILDEPTAALDAQSEFELIEAMNRLMARRTTFIIAHRLSTIRNADRILVLQHGQLLESGSHETLLSLGGIYARMQNVDFAGRQPALEHIHV